MILCLRGVFEVASEVEIERWGGRESKSDHAILWIGIDGFDMRPRTGGEDTTVKDVT